MDAGAEAERFIHGAHPDHEDARFGWLLGSEYDSFRHIFGLVETFKHWVTWRASAVIKAIIRVGAAGCNDADLHVVGIALVVDGLRESDLGKLRRTVNRLVGQAS